METMQLDDTELRETAKQLYESYSTVLSESKLASILQDALGDFAPCSIPNTPHGRPSTTW